MTRARFDGLADWYDREFATSPLVEAPREIVLRLLGEGPGRLLDVGCGTGLYSVALAERGWAVTGVDISEDMLRLARARGVDAVHADAEALPFDNESFDAVVSICTHTDADDFAAVVQGVARVGPHSRFEEAGAREYPYLVAVRCRT